MGDRMKTSVAGVSQQVGGVRLGTAGPKGAALGISESTMAGYFSH